MNVPDSSREARTFVPSYPTPRPLPKQQHSKDSKLPVGLTVPAKPLAEHWRAEVFSSATERQQPGFIRLLPTGNNPDCLDLARARTSLKMKCFLARETRLEASSSGWRFSKAPEASQSLNRALVLKALSELTQSHTTPLLVVRKNAVAAQGGSGSRGARCLGPGGSVSISISISFPSPALGSLPGLSRPGPAPAERDPMAAGGLELPTTTPGQPAGRRQP